MANQVCISPGTGAFRAVDIFLQVKFRLFDQRGETAQAQSLALTLDSTYENVLQQINIVSLLSL